MTTVTSHHLTAHVAVLSKSFLGVAIAALEASSAVRGFGHDLRKSRELTRLDGAARIERRRIEAAHASGDATFGIKSKGRRGAWRRSQMMMRALGQEL